MTDDESQPDDTIAALIFAGLATRTYTPPVPTTDREFVEVSLEDYATLLTPDATIAQMPYGLASYEQLSRELRNGRYRAVAHEIIWTFKGRTGRDRYALIPDFIWSYHKPEFASDFWQTGYFDTFLPGEGGHYLAESGGSIRVFGTRFWVPPEQAIEHPGSGPTESPLNETKPSVAKADLKRWHDVFVGVHPGAAEALALQSAIAMFPNNNVPRQWVRDLRGPQRRGKPPTRHD